MNSFSSDSLFVLTLSYTTSAVFSLPDRHYAGDVVYNIKGFLEKNKDTLFQDFKRLMFSSSDPVISSMWPEGAQDITMVGLDNV